MIKQALYDELPDIIAGRLNSANTYALKLLGSNIKRIGVLMPGDVHRIEELQRAGIDIAAIEREIAEQTGKAVEEVQALFEAAAIENIEQAHALYAARGLPLPDYATNDYMRRLVESWTRRTAGELVNLSQTSALQIWSEKKGEYTTLAEGYKDAIDQAVTNTALGVTDYKSAMRSTIKNIAGNGITTMEYASGVHRRLDTAVRANILEGVRQVNQGIQDQIGEEVGADGVEISVHTFCAPDHESIQGKQMSHADFEKWQAAHAYPKRQIGKLNCHHFAFAVILGISPATYTPEQLAEMRADNAKGIDYQGRHYTMYECTQIQRQLETAVRKSKDVYVMAQAAGDKTLMASARKNITELTDQYRAFSDKAKLPVKNDRLSVVGFSANKSA